MVMLEAFSAVGDEFSYLQDRIHHERAIETATERRSAASWSKKPSS